MQSKFTITSPASVADLKVKLSASLTTDRPGILWSQTTTFQGAVFDSGFWVTRNLALMEKTFPIIATGTFASSSGGTDIEVVTRPRWFVMLFLTAWSGIWGYLACKQLVDISSSWAEVGVFVGFLAFGWFLVLIGSTMEENRYKEALTKLLTEP